QPGHLVGDQADVGLGGGLHRKAGAVAGVTDEEERVLQFDHGLPDRTAADVASGAPGQALQAAGGGREVLGVLARHPPRGRDQQAVVGEHDPALGVRHPLHQVIQEPGQVPGRSRLPHVHPFGSAGGAGAAPVPVALGPLARPRSVPRRYARIISRACSGSRVAGSAVPPSAGSGGGRLAWRIRHGRPAGVIPPTAPLAVAAARSGAASSAAASSVPASHRCRGAWSSPRRCRITGMPAAPVGGSVPPSGGPAPPSVRTAAVAEPPRSATAAAPPSPPHPAPAAPAGPPPSAPAPPTSPPPTPPPPHPPGRPQWPSPPGRPLRPPRPPPHIRHRPQWRCPPGRPLRPPRPPPHIRHQPRGPPPLARRPRLRAARRQCLRGPRLPGPR